MRTHSLHPCWGSSLLFFFFLVEIILFPDPPSQHAVTFSRAVLGQPVGLDIVSRLWASLAPSAYSSSSNVLR